MKVKVKITQSFKKQAKPLLKKYLSLSDELIQLENKLKNNPRLGKALGHEVYKIRLAVKSKGKGKSGGLRIISYLKMDIILEIEKEEETISVNLLTIYDKSETSTITGSEIVNLIRKINQH